jgi:acyl-lipid omega-6 desaturase (Delta-12 desaturase)
MAISPAAPKDAATPRDEHRALMASLADFQRPSTARSASQLAVTAGAYIAILAAMYAAWHLSVWLSLALVIPAAGLVVRLFIIQHDCGHGAYFRSARANAIVGSLCSLATFTPYAVWRRHHAGHHVMWNNLDHRDTGVDIYSTCLTVAEYAALSPRRRFLYRLSRHPVLIYVLVPPVVFLLLYRLPFDTPKNWHRERRGVQFTNAALAVLFASLILFLGWQRVVAVQVPIVACASIVGVWLFSVQHRFEQSAWMRQADWSAFRAALHGCSYLRLPRVLQWFTGNIGFHHIHHLLPRVPNYRLQACHEALLARQGPVTTLNLLDGLKAPSFALWDEARQLMVPFPGKKESVLF